MVIPPTEATTERVTASEVQWEAESVTRTTTVKFPVAVGTQENPIESVEVQPAGSPV